MPRCTMAARVGALLPIEEIGPDRNRSIGLPLLLTDGGSVIDLKSHTKSQLLMEIKKKLKHRFQDPYGVSRNFVLRINHVAVRKSRFAE